MADALKACALRSGSSGNAIFVGGAGTRLLIDAGICCRSIEDALAAIEEEAAALSAVLITHEHSDHIAGVGPLLRRYKLPLYTTRGTWEAMRPLVGRVNEAQIHLIEPGRQTEIGDLAITAYSTAHDAAEPVGYRIESGQSAVAVLTDTGHLVDGLIEAVAGCRAIFLEANYDHAMLLAGSYPAMLKERIIGRYGHLSNDDSAAAACQLLERGTSRFILSHISKDNNYPELALLTVGSKLHEAGASNGDYRLAVARRYAISDPVLL
jgi:phosphoribosyl 1,2-cyclic phosphodiesterase